LGFLPAQKLYVTKIFISQWFLAGLVAFFCVKNFWFKLFLLWITARMIIGYQTINNLAILMFLTIALTGIYWQFVQKINKQDFLNILCIIALIQIGWIYMQIAGYEPLFKVTPLYKNFANLNTGLMGNTNLSGILLALCVPAFFRKGWAWLLPLFIYPFYKVNCTTALVALAIGAIFYLYHKFKIIWPTIIFAPIALFLGWPKIIAFNAGPRLNLWKTLIPIIKQHPIAGYGIGQYKYVSSPVITTLKRIAPLNWSTAHNDFLQLWIDVGLVAVLIIVGFLISLFLKRHNDYVLAAIILIGVICSMGFFVAYTPLMFITLGAGALIMKGKRNADTLYGV